MSIKKGVGIVLMSIALLFVGNACTRKNIYGIAQTRQEFIPVESIIAGLKNTRVDLGIWVDRSGSMGPYQQSLKELAADFYNTYFGVTTPFGEQPTNCVASWDFDEYLSYDDGRSNAPTHQGCTDQLPAQAMIQVLEDSFSPGLGGEGVERPINSLMATIRRNEVGPTAFFKEDGFPIVAIIGDEDQQDAAYNRITGEPYDIEFGTLNNYMSEADDPCPLGPQTYNLLDGNQINIHLLECPLYNDPGFGNVPEIDVQAVSQDLENFFKDLQGDNYRGFGFFAITQQNRDTLIANINDNDPNDNYYGPDEYAPNLQVENLGKEIRDNIDESTVVFQDINTDNAENIIDSFGELIISLNTAATLQFQANLTEEATCQVQLEDGTLVDWSTDNWTINGSNFELTQEGIQAALLLPVGAVLVITYYPLSLANL